MRIRTTIVPAAATALLLTGPAVDAAAASAVSTDCTTFTAGASNADDPAEAVVPVPGKHGGAGAVVVMRGGGRGLTSGVTLVAGRDGVPGTDRRLAAFGSGIASGDIDHDSCGDVAIAAPGASAGAGELGTVTVLYAGADGALATGRAQLVDADDLHLKPQHVPGSRAGDSIVRSIGDPVIGDFFGNGYGDLAVVAMTTDESRSPYRTVAEVVVVRGGRSGLDLARTNAFVPPSLATGPGGSDVGGAVDLIEGPVTSTTTDSLGVVIDGGSATPTGAPRHGDVSAHGVVDVVAGAQHFPRAAATEVWDRESAGVPGSDTTHGDTLSAVFGDFTGSGYDGLAIGDAHDGEVTVIPGSASGLRGRGAAVLRPGGGGVPGSPRSDPGFGKTVATGDFNGDTDDELVVADSAGTLTVLPGTRAHGLVTAGALRITTSTAGVPGTRDASFGSTLTTGRFGGASGGGDDLLVGDPLWDHGAGSLTELLGHRSPNVGLGVQGAREFTESSPGVPGLAVAGDLFGGG